MSAENDQTPMGSRDVKPRWGHVPGKFGGMVQAIWPHGLVFLMAVGGFLICLTRDAVTGFFVAGFVVFLSLMSKLTIAIIRAVDALTKCASESSNADNSEAEG